jgi:hypothetical protein
MISKSDELKDRIEAKRHELMAKMSEVKADSRKEARDAYDKAKGSLAELEETLKDGWDKMSDVVRSKLNTWLDRT